jgi:leader peptidase (prepilin peptidase)/N-methyltransferase
VLALPSLVNPRGMGMGDAKLIAILGLFLGRSVAPAFFVAFIVGTAVGIGVIMRKGMMEGRKTAIPFGPFLALGGVVAILAGDELVQLYLDTF